MKQKQNPMNNIEMISILEQLKHDINADIERRKLAYIGKDEINIPFALFISFIKNSNLLLYFF